MRSIEEIEQELEHYQTISDSYKIVLNGSFGKFGSKWSKLYSPDLLLQVTITGQLTLLMLIEQLESKGVGVVSANTDGLEMNVASDKEEKFIRKRIKKLDKKTGYEMEIGDYVSLHARDVNNYVAKYDGYVKLKGIFAEPSLSKNIQTPIVFKAVADYINKGTPIEDTIKGNDDIRNFLTARNVKGGAMFGTDIPELYPDGWQEQLERPRGLTKKIITERAKMEAQWVKAHGNYLGKIARWYYSTKGSSIHYKSNGNLVPKSEGAMPMMNLPKKNKIPKDLDIQWYITEAIQTLSDLGMDYDQR